MRYVPGSGIGIRVTAAVWGGVMILGGLVGVSYGSADHEAWLFLLMPLFVIVRSWWLGVWLTEDGFVVKSWFRRRRVRSCDIVRIDLSAVYSGLLGVGTRFIPFVGSVRIIEVEIKDRWLPLSFPTTVGRRNRVLRLVRELREHTGAPRSGSIFNSGL
ncbi:hypothetical protein [Microbacterium sp.]|uniref:hypothetical protein n=1 Tax=Microbacterium sp. TaxID=51671 RepID=UPI0039E4D200